MSLLVVELVIVFLPEAFPSPPSNFLYCFISCLTGVLIFSNEYFRSKIEF